MGVQLRGALTGCRGTSVRRTRNPGAERGAAAVEFALIAIPLLTLMVGIIQIAVFFWAFQAGSFAAGEGARRYSVDPCGSYADVVRTRLGAASTDASAATVGVTRTGTAVGETVTVTVTYGVARFATGLIPGLPSTLTKSATARIEDVTGCP